MNDKERRRRYDKVVGQFSQDMFRYAFWLSHDRQLAEDVVQDAMLRAWKSLDQLQEDGAAKYWLFTIVRREHARFYERKRLETVDIDTPGLHDENLTCGGWNHDVEAVRDAMGELPLDYREPLVLQVSMGYSVKEIAKLMELGEGAVLTRLFRARKKLKNILHDSYGDE
ncbi:MAG: sigma-70 family RNA polymerase sigma factor [Gammaproteobacteria bacterium]|nr:sigma-70 family RNA polymerase sigma factor [Gammaproteobacteria bacterium]